MTGAKPIKNGFTKTPTKVEIRIYLIKYFSSVWFAPWKRSKKDSVMIKNITMSGISYWKVPAVVKTNGGDTIKKLTTKAR